MNTFSLAKLYLLALTVFLVIDGLWLGVVARDFYRRQLEPLLRAEPNWTAAIVFYLLFVGGLLVFAVLPALERGSVARATVLGGLFGLVTYGTYDLTNMATLRQWPLPVVVVDMTWGMLVAASTATAASYFGRNWLS